MSTQESILLPFSEYLDYQKPRLSENSHKAYSSVITRFKAFLNAHPLEDDRPIGAWLRQSTNAYLDSMGTKSRLHFNRDKSVIGHFLKWLYTNEYLDRLLIPDAKFKMTDEIRQMEDKKARTRRDSVLREQEIEDILNVLRRERPRDYIIFLLMFNFALRSDDLHNMRRRDFEIDAHGQCWLKLVGKVEKRTGKPALIEVSPIQVYQIVMAYMDGQELFEPSDYIITQYKQRLKPNSGASKIPLGLHGIQQTIEMNTKSILGRRITSHYLRRSRVTLLRHAGESDQRISKLCRMGISTLNTHYDTRKGEHQLGHTVKI